MSNGKTLVDYHICRVCGDRASGFHYGVFCCEGCKGFFYRSVQAVKKYKFCNTSGGCLVLKTSRNSCKFCRMQRCLEVGMSYEAVKMGRCRKTDLESRRNMLIRVTDNPDEVTIGVYRAYVNASKQQPACHYQVEKYSIIRDQSMLYEKYLPSVISFITCVAKELAWFGRLPANLQRVLIKSSLIEMLVIQDAGYIEVVCDECVNHRLNYVTDLRQLKELGSLGRVLSGTLEVSVKLNKLSLTPVEISLLIALCLFSSDREGLNQDQNGITEIEEKLLLTIKCQLFMNHSQPRRMLPKVIEIICSLRGLTSLYLDSLLESTMDEMSANRDNTRSINNEPTYHYII